MNKYLISYDISNAENYNEVKDLFLQLLEQYGTIEDNSVESTLTLNSSYSENDLNIGIISISYILKKRSGASITFALK